MTFEKFVSQRQQPLLRLAMVLSGDGSHAEEIVQAVLVRAWERWDRIRSLDAPDAYVRRMVVNEFLSLRRRWARLVPFDPRRHGEQVADHANAHADRDALVAELAKLPRRQRAVLALRYYDGLTDDQIADVLGCTAGTVRGYASRALATLRIELDHKPTVAHAPKRSEK